MKLRLLAAAAVLLGAPQVAQAQWRLGYIRLSPSPSPSVCWISEPEGGGIMEVYVVYDGDYGILTAGFRVRSGEGFTGVYFDETVETQGPTWGNTQDGLVISGIYKNGPLLLATIRYLTDGTSASCSHLEVVAHPEYGCIFITDVHDVHFLDEYGPFLVNVPWPDDTCVWCVSPNPVEPTTWGRIKALYAE